jgi:uncharacterized membrane protein
VDILNIMGVAIVAAGAAWAAAGSAAARAGLFAAMAAAIAMLTPVVRALPAVTALPDWIEWYLAPAGDLTTFTLFPWAAFLFAGAACGAVLAGTADRASEHRAQFAFAACGTALVVAGYYLSFRPSIYEQSSFWTSSPTWFAIRLGVLMIGAAAVHALAEATYAAGVSCRPLERLGRHSLFVYWVHVELVYGYASWPLRSRLPLWAAVAGCVGFGLLMYRAIGLRDRFAAHPALRRYVPRLVLRHRPAHGQLT